MNKIIFFLVSLYFACRFLYIIKKFIFVFITFYIVLKKQLSTPVESLTNTTRHTSSAVQDRLDESLILSVQKRPALYDNKNVPVKERTRLKKTALWLDVSQELQCDADDLKTRWESLRSRYMRVRSATLAYKPSGSAAKSPKDPC